MANFTSGLSGVGADAFRVRRLNCDGTVVDEPDDNADIVGYATCKMSEITLTPEVLEGEVIQQRNAGGRLCVNIERDDEVTGYTAEVEQCDLDAEFQEIIGAAAGRITTGSAPDTIGVILPGGTQSCSCSGAAAECRDVVAEFWVPLYDCNELTGYARWVLPRIRFTLGTNTLTFGNAAILPRFTGKVKPNTSLPADGPWGDFPAGITGADGSAPFWFFEETLPAGLDTDTGTYIPDESP